MACQGFHVCGRFVEYCLICVYKHSQINSDAVTNDGKLLLHRYEFCGVGLRPLASWDCGFESRRGHGCRSCECCVLSGREVSAPLSLSRGVISNVVCLGYLGRSVGTYSSVTRYAAFRKCELHSLLVVEKFSVMNFWILEHRYESLLLAD
jgi:hypothetical protein